tara:strand:- start:108 stop:470 length:363 start_codon:yes stop_codon:yes gene_type:complete
MTTAEKILSIFIVILLAITIVLGIQKSKLDAKIGAAEYAVIEIREARIKAYDNQIDLLNVFILKLQTERLEIDEQENTLPSVAVIENDSIALLPYDEQSIFIANGLSLLDSIERRHFSGL